MVTREEHARQYSLTREQAMDLAGLAALPTAVREEMILKLAVRRGPVYVARLLAQFIGLANSVVHNNREAIENFAIVDGAMHPHTAEKLNLPDIFGACNGAALAVDIDQAKLCGGCAFRLGTCANQSGSTTCDADYLAHPGEEPFYCHEDMNEDGTPKRACAGFAQLRARRNAA